MKILVALIFAASLAVPGLANASTLSGKEIRSLVGGKRVFLKVPFGGEFPLRYARNGVVSGDGTGFGLGRFLAPKDRGRWWIRNNQLCQKWNQWYKKQTACFEISDLQGDKFRWKRNDGRKGRARVE